MLYLVFSLDENYCQEYWNCFGDRREAEKYLGFAYNEICEDLERIGCGFKGHIDDEWGYARIEANDGSDYLTEIFLVEILESKIMSAIAR